MEGVADAVTNGTLTLNRSTAVAQDGRDLLNVTGGADSSSEYFSSSFTFNVLNNSIVIGRIFTDNTKSTGSQNPSTLAMNVDATSAWYLLNDNNNIQDNYDSSNVTTLDLRGNIFLNSQEVWNDSFPENTQPENYGTLILDSLTGSGRLNLYSNMETKETDKVSITAVDGASGDHTIYVKNDASQATTIDDTLVIIETSGGDGTFALKNSVELGAYAYDLRKTDDDNWELYYKKSSTANEAFYGILSTNYLINNADVHTLQQRMGELRFNYSTGAWGRTYFGKLDSFQDDKLQGLTMNYFGIQIGVDETKTLTVLTGTEEKEYEILFGYTGGYIQGEGTKPEEDVMDSYISINNYNLGYYLVFMNQTGFYLDTFTKVGAFYNQFQVEDTEHNIVEGKGISFNIVANLELGQRINIMNTGLYIEPQVQLTYTGNENMRVWATNGLDLTRKAYHSLILRTSLLAGLKIEGNSLWNIYFRTGLSNEFLGDVTIVYNNSTEEVYSFYGLSFNNSIGINLVFSEANQLYLEVTYDKGDNFTGMRGTLGYRNTF